jgi:TctA family transporter
MDIFSAALSALNLVLTIEIFFMLLIGICYGIFIGLMPGLGGIVAIALLLPFTIGFDITATLALLLGAHIATIWGGSVTSILFNVPGSAKSLALVFDGHPMTKKGEASRALGASAMAALLGGIIGAIFLALSIPIIRPVMLSIGPSEYLVLALWGLTIIATFSEGSMLKGAIATCLGMMIAFIGMDPITGTPRFWFDSIYLMDGIYFPIAMIGMFAISEMIKLYIKKGSFIERVAGQEDSSVLTGCMDAFKHWWLVIRSSLLGLWIGVLPGIGASVGGIAAYAQAVQTSKDPDKFGKGAVEGVIAPDATLGANEGGGLLPTLAFGIPGGESMAILLVAFLNMGIVPGPQMLTTDLDLVFVMVWIIVFANLFTTLLGLIISPKLAKLPGINPNIMIPMVLSVCIFGAYATRGYFLDVAVAFLFGILGYYMDKFNFSRANFVIGMVLADMIERNLHISIGLDGSLFIFNKPVSIAMLCLLVITTFLSLNRKKKNTP